MYEEEPIQDEQVEESVNFAVIPMEVMDDREKLTTTEIVIFGYLNNLDNKKTGRGCFASNRWLSERLKMSTRVIIDAIKTLSTEGYITVEYEQKTSKRTIWTNYGFTKKHLKKTEQTLRNSATPPCDIPQSPLAKSCTQSNLNISNLNLEPSSKEEGTSPAGEFTIFRKRMSREQDPDISDHASNILSHWHSINLAGKRLRHHKIGTKTYEHIKSAVDQCVSGTFFNNKDKVSAKDRKFRLGEIRTAIDRFAKSALMPEYLPANEALKERKQKMSLFDFFYSPMCQTDSLEWVSPFLYYVDNDATPCSERMIVTVNKDDPTVKLLAGEFKRIARLNGNDLSARQYKDLAFAKKRLEGVMPEYREKIRNFDHWKNVHKVKDDVSLLAVFLSKAVEEEALHSSFTLTTGWFCSDNAINTRLPKYLKETNYLKG